MNLPDLHSTKRQKKVNDPTSALVSKKCHYCGLLPSDHYCRKKVKGSGVVIQGKEEEEICRKLSCMVCRMKWSELED